MTPDEKLTASVRETLNNLRLRGMYERTLKNLLASAWQDGVILQVDIVSDQPPAMGNYHQVVSSRVRR